ncbi:MAG: diguanylate cyclase [Frankiales bacterium]|nr:diguanylate cyclase [Frankiales bacterium]
MAPKGDRDAGSTCRCRVMRVGSSPGADLHRAERVQRARATSLVISVTALFVVPAWSLFDLVLEPTHAGTFIALRFVSDLPILAGIWLLRRGPDLRRPELVALGVLAVVQCEIAWMVSRAGDNRQFYLLGFTLALYAGGLLLGGALWGTGLLVAVTFGAFTAFSTTTPVPLTARDVVAAVTYLATSSVIALLSHRQRNRATSREFSVRAELEREQEHSRALLDRLEQQSRQDPLTGLANRRAWDEQLQACCAQANADGGSVALVLLDLDWFKQVNDRHGHGSGDEALRQIAAVLTQRAPEGSVVARLGGDEFALLLPGRTAREAVALAEQVRADTQAQTVLGTENVGLSVSQGVAACQGQHALPSLLMSSADRELYRAKATRNAVSVQGRRAIPTQRSAAATQLAVVPTTA